MLPTPTLPGAETQCLGAWGPGETGVPGDSHPKSPPGAVSAQADVAPDGDSRGFSPAALLLLLTPGQSRLSDPAPLTGLRTCVSCLPPSPGGRQQPPSPSPLPESPLGPPPSPRQLSPHLTHHQSATQHANLTLPMGGSCLWDLLCEAPTVPSHLHAVPSPFLSVAQLLPQVPSNALSLGRGPALSSSGWLHACMCPTVGRLLHHFPLSPSTL